MDSRGWATVVGLGCFILVVLLGTGGVCHFTPGGYDSRFGAPLQFYALWRKCCVNRTLGLCDNHSPVGWLGTVPRGEKNPPVAGAS